VRDLIFNNKSTYGEFLNTDEKIATNILADRLATLETGRIISRYDHPESKVKVLYKLTEKGIDLIPVLVEIIVWSEKYHDVHPYAPRTKKNLVNTRAVCIAINGNARLLSNTESNSKLKRIT
jgi:DNA-binding HxlR family transcriptional regulator